MTQDYFVSLTCLKGIKTGIIETKQCFYDCFLIIYLEFIPKRFSFVAATSNINRPIVNILNTFNFMILEEKRKAAEQALLDGKQKLALDEIADIFKAIHLKDSHENAIKGNYTIFIICMAKYHKVNYLFNSGQLSTSEYLIEFGKLNETIVTILDDLETILEKIGQNKIEIVIDENTDISIKIPKNYVFEEDKFLRIVENIAAELDVNIEELLFKKFKDKKFN